MSEGQVTTGIAGALAAIVAAFVWLVKRRDKDEESPADAILKDIGLIEREEIDLPANWRRFVDDRIDHKMGNLAHMLMLWARMLDRGVVAEVAIQLRDEAERLVKKREEAR